MDAFVIERFIFMFYKKYSKINHRMLLKNTNKRVSFPQMGDI